MWWNRRTWPSQSSLAVCRPGHKTQTDTKTHPPTHSTPHSLLLFPFYLTFGKKSSTSHWHLTGSLDSINPPGVGGSRELPREENAFINSRTDFSQEKLGPTLKKKPGNQIFLYSCRTESLNPNISYQSGFFPHQELTMHTVSTLLSVLKPWVHLTCLRT